MARAENLAIMFVDMAGFAERTARQSRAQNKIMLRDLYGLLIPLIARFGGNRVKSIGDALLVTFRSPTDSVRCGMAMHDAVASYNQRVAEPIRIRVALNVGEVRLERSDVFGEAVNIAARVEEVTPAGEIYLTGVVYLSMNKTEVPSEHIGEHRLKGIPEPVRLFRVPQRPQARLNPSAESVQAAVSELPFSGMHLLPDDTDMLARVADSLRRAPYVDWSAKARAVPLRAVLTGIGATGLAVALISVAYGLLVMKPVPSPVQSAAQAAAALPPPPAPVSAEARAMLTAGHTAYFERRYVDAAGAYAKALEMAPELRHDSGLAANLVGTLGRAGEGPGNTIRKYLSPELVYELGRRTGLPGRKGAQRAASLLTEASQEARIDRASMALNEFAEAPSCEERLVAVKDLRELKVVRAVPVLKEGIRRGLSGLFKEDRNKCLRDEAQATIAELEKLSPPPPPS